MLSMPVMPSNSNIPNDSNIYNSDRPPPPPNLLGGADLKASSHGLDQDPGDPGPVLPLHAIPPSAFDTRNMQDLDALKAQVEALAGLGSVPFHQSSQVGFDPGLASPDSAGAASSPSVFTLPSPTSAMFSWMGTYYMSPEGHLPSPTTSAFTSASPSPFSSGPSSAYSPEEYRSRPSQALDPPISPPAYPYQEGYADYPAVAPSPLFGSGYGLHPSAFALPPPAQSPDSAALRTAGLLPALPDYSAFPEMHASLLPPTPHTDGPQNPPVAPRIEAICPICGKGLKYKKNLKLHVKEKHDPSFCRSRCLYSDCTASYLRPSDLKDHVRKKHPTIPDQGLVTFGTL